MRVRHALGQYLNTFTTLNVAVLGFEVKYKEYPLNINN